MRLNRRDMMKWTTGGTAALGISAEAMTVDAKGATDLPYNLNHHTLRAFPDLPPDRFDVRNWALYDTFVSTNPSSYHLFIEPVGRYRTLSETNMWQAGRLPMPTEFRVERIFLLLESEAPKENTDSFMNVAVLRVDVGSKVMFQMPFRAFGAPSKNKAAFILASNLHPTGMCPSNAFVMAPENAMHIPMGLSFSAQVEASEAWQEYPFSIKVFLDGQIARATQ